MKVVIDIEANGLENPTEIWLIVCKDIETKQLHIFRNVTQNEFVKNDFKTFIESCKVLIGHNALGYDIPVISKLCGIDLSSLVARTTDTLIVSKLVEYSRPGHSIEQYGEEFGYPKIKFDDFSKYSEEMEKYCIRDVEITEKVFNKYRRIIDDLDWQPSIKLEHEFQLVVNALHDNGFYFNSKRADTLLSRVTKELEILDKEILKEFPPRLRPIKEIHPRETKFGTLNKSDFRWVADGDLSIFNGGPFTRCEWVDFNPSSHKQIIEVLNAAGWKPTEKTKTHLDTLRELNILKRSRKRDSQLDIQIKLLDTKIVELEQTGWKINETNLATLPNSAPSPAKTLSKRILLESRRRTLVEWLSLVSPETGRIHGKYYGIGAWTHRMAHQSPNTANIPTEAKLFGKEMRQLWCAPKNRLIVGVDAEGIQLRIFAHYINDPEFTQSLVEGKKDDKTDPHSLNQRILGSSCKNRQAAKRFIYALLLGAGINKLAEILECSVSQAEEALGRLLQRYTGWAQLKQEVFPIDAKRGWFQGLDGRKVRIPGDSEGSRKHLAMSGYLQNGEAVIMKKACLKWHEQLKQEFGHGLRMDHSNPGNGSDLVHASVSGPERDQSWFIVNFVHDEWQTEVPNDVSIALRIAEIQANSLKLVGEELKLNCPLAGSYWNEDHKDYTIGTNWYQTH